MGNTINTDASNRCARKRGQKYATQRVANRVTIATFERLDHDAGVTSVTFHFAHAKAGLSNAVLIEAFCHMFPLFLLLHKSEESGSWILLIYRL
ncbi:hypothetical protein SDC9_157836 [bioreactor metagenome]|uniref:Uncharacterized protein n=1 Tax=bioreactor metagenome TaxID=1076179 RepID=A0A645F8B2_9ZZZZ